MFLDCSRNTHPQIHTHSLSLLGSPNTVPGSTLCWRTSIWPQTSRAQGPEVTVDLREPLTRLFHSGGRASIFYARGRNRPASSEAGHLPMWLSSFLEQGLRFCLLLSSCFPAFVYLPLFPYHSSQTFIHSFMYSVLALPLRSFFPTPGSWQFFICFLSL